MPRACTGALTSRWRYLPHRMFNCGGIRIAGQEDAVDQAQTIRISSSKLAKQLQAKVVGTKLSVT
jgi:hypothetical protein